MTSTARTANRRYAWDGDEHRLLTAFARSAVSALISSGEILGRGEGLLRGTEDVSNLVVVAYDIAEAMLIERRVRLGMDVADAAQEKPAQSTDGEAR